MTPSGHTSGGERRYQPEDLEQLRRILEMKDVLGLGLDEIKGFLDSEARIAELRNAYRRDSGAQDQAAKMRRREILEEALVLAESLAAQLSVKLAKMDAFRSKLSSDVERCRELLAELTDLTEH